MGTRLNDIWITGALGYLGRALTQRFADAGYTVYATGHEVDVCDLDEVTAFIGRNRPTVVVNCTRASAATSCLRKTAWKR